MINKANSKEKQDIVMLLNDKNTVGNCEKYIYQPA